MKNMPQPKKQDRFTLTFKSLDGQVLSSERLAAQAQLVTGFSSFVKKPTPGGIAINFIDDVDNDVAKGIDELTNAPFHLTLGLVDMFGNVVESYEFRDVTVAEVLHSGVGIDMDSLTTFGVEAGANSWIIKTVYFDYANVINTLHK